MLYTNGGQNAEYGNPDWNIHKDYGQPKWEQQGLIHDPTDAHDARTHSDVQGYYEREQRELRSWIDVEEIVERFDQWVRHQPNEMYRVVWFQSLRREIFTGEKAPEEGIRRLAHLIYGNELYRTKAGTLKLRREQWLNTFYNADDKLREKLRQFIESMKRA